MAKERSSGLRQRTRTGSATEQPAASQQAAGSSDEPPTQAQVLNYYFAQYIGLVVCVIGIALMAFGYDKEWMHNTHLCMLSLGLCCLGLFFHELRPFNAQQVYEEELKAKQTAVAAAAS